MIFWPSELPMPRIGTEYKPVDPQLRTPMQSGRTFVRRNFTAVPVNFTASWVIKGDANAALFEDFYRLDLEDGTLWFEMPLLLPQGRGERLVQFQGIYSGPRRLNAPGASDGVWEYSANMQMFLRPGETAPVDRNVYRVTESGAYRILE